MRTILQPTNSTIQTEHFASLYNTMLEANDQANANKITDLYEKFKYNQLHLAFAGHFSAGKSSIINHVLDKDVLPKSPIPTSANIVNVTSGEGNAQVFFKEAQAVQYNEPYNIDVIKDYCMDKDTIKQINISTKEKILPANCILMDTPGIDAADDADRLMTESAVHVIDVLFYVMDYNHVQSEVNLYFLQEMKKRNIPIFIIINQIDKHNSAELSFDEYDKKVKQTFDQWNIRPENIYYTSMLEADHAQNQFPALKEQLFQLMSYPIKQDERVSAALEKVIADHKSMVREQLEAATSEATMGDAEVKEMAALKSKLAALNDTHAQLKKDYTKEVKITLDNAYIMPATLRDTAEYFLKSQEKGFKTGFIGAKKKTAEEQEKRLQQFLEELTTSFETTIQWKLREKITELLQSYELGTEELLKSAQQLTISFDERDLYDFMKPGAMVNGNYVLNYTNEISQSIKNKFRKQTNALWDQIAAESEKKKEKETKEIKALLDPLESQQELAFENEQIEEKIAQKEKLTDEAFHSPVPTEMDKERLEHALVLRYKVNIEESPDKILPSAIQTESETEVSHQPSQPKQNKAAIIHSLDTVIAELSDIEGFDTIVDGLQNKQNRLQNRSLTVALFGTFSAGKSSFSNALFGEKVLPVSPNPTTAVINRISPVDASHPHGTVLITIKNEQELMDDLKTITKHIEGEANSFAEWMNWIQKDKIYEHPYLSKTYQAYLEALLAGFDQQRDQLGDSISISMDDFAAFVTDEAKACYIQAVDLYYDCDLTRKGITLVDTPGADSVNARHTNVAFDYIKEADAILYVTYYNHAITSGDRDFLIQLGRVKDSFEMDKMFFIVNASDLAETQEDLDLVVKYVTGQLLHFGIRHPKIFPVSSKQSLAEKIDGQELNEEMNAFEEDFFRFIDEDLTALTVESSLWDMERARNTLQQFIHSLQLSESDKEKQLEVLQENKIKGTQVIEQMNTDMFQQRVFDRIDRQLYFVMDRLYIRFHDLFSEHFNASTMNASGKQATQQLEYNRNQLVDYIGYELLQEVRAVALRVEAYMKELFQETYDVLQKETKSIDNSFVFSSHDAVILNTPVFEEAFKQLDMSIFQKALKIFKNTKSFFEQNDRKKMEEAFYDIIKPRAQTYLDEAKQVMETSYLKQFEEEINHIKSNAVGEIQQLVNQQMNLLTTPVDIDALQEKYECVKGVLNN
ncbi:MAG TPA: dynamin family protein [Virgibacillus sp.]|nr:dynamin family protein [Virgibacillus sp.]HLR68849.1 dynamin family protein [Virgibacillus sp.]